LRRHRAFPHWIRVATGLPGNAVQSVDVEAGKPLPDHGDYAGIIITGSGAMVTERRDWSESTAAWLHGAAHAGAAIFGICYGHQLLAHAFGGTVADNPVGREMGTAPIQRHDTADDDPLFAALPHSFRAQTTHRQTVLAPPPGATVLARSERDACQAFRFGTCSWGVQFHPEFSSGMMRGYIAGRADVLRREGVDPSALHRAVRPTPLARGVLSRFVRHARQVSTG
jgi:GMP synthase (glutamine-hydrolysing)